MNKAEFLGLIVRLYREGNRADSDEYSGFLKNSGAESWLCSNLDKVLNSALETGVISRAEFSEVMNNL